MGDIAKTNKLVLKTFLEELSNFIDLLCSNLPPSKEMDRNKAYFISCKKINPRIILFTWESDIATRFHSEIERGDLQFFATHDYINDDHLKSHTPLIINLFENLKSNILLLDKEVQDTIIRYIQNISKISKLYKQ